MLKPRKPEALTLFVGDMLCFVAALWLTLLLRYQAFPPWWLFEAHLEPFIFLFGFSILTFFIAGLYEKQTVSVRGKLLTLLFNAQVANALLAIAFFYFLPNIGIEPRTNLFIYIIVSSALIFSWRFLSDRLLRASQRISAITIGTSSEIRELHDEINGNERYNLFFEAQVPESASIDEIREVLIRNGIRAVVSEPRDPKLHGFLPLFYKLRLEGIRFIDSGTLYEEVFDRIPLSSLTDEWLLEEDSRQAHFAYDGAKRVFDIFGALIISVIAIPVSIVAGICLKLASPGPVFISQERVGENNRIFRLMKFRSWLFDDHGDPELHKNNRITAVGKILRTTRIDELPQLWNVIRGELSFIGPRPEIPGLVTEYEKEIPYYRTRHLIRPGLSGWAQINDYDAPREKVEVGKTRRKLSYDLYYLKHRSIFLDLKIGLRTIQTLLSRTGI